MPDKNKNDCGSKNRCRAFTLTETLITLAIASIVMSAGIPAYSAMLERNEAHNDMRQLYRLFADAHAYAVLHSKYVTLCPLDHSGNCHNDWMAEISVFEDHNDDRELDANERILLIVDAVDRPQVTRTYGSRRAVTFSPMGDSLGFNGTLRYCFHGRNEHNGGVIIHGTGRIRAATDLNGDGLADENNGRTITCD